MNYKYEDNLRSERLITRFLTIDDVKTWAQFLGDKECTRYYPKTDFKTPLEYSDFWIGKQIERYKEKKYGLQALINSANGEFIGICGLLLQNVNGTEEVEVGYHIFKDHWKKGYAIEAAKLFKEYGFKNKQADSIVSIIHHQNIPSQNVAIKNGMLKEKQTNWKDLDVFIFRTQ